MKSFDKTYKWRRTMVYHQRVPKKSRSQLQLFVNKLAIRTEQLLELEAIETVISMSKHKNYKIC